MRRGRPSVITLLRAEFSPDFQRGPFMNRLTKAAIVAVALSTTAVPLAAEAQSRRDRQERTSSDRRRVA